jgi:hypothetical protein
MAFPQLITLIQRKFIESAAKAHILQSNKAGRRFRDRQLEYIWN